MASRLQLRLALIHARDERTERRRAKDLCREAYPISNCKHRASFAHPSTRMT